MEHDDIEKNIDSVIEFEEGWGIESYGGSLGFGGSCYGVRHKHEGGWKMAIGSPRTCSCGAVAPANIEAWLEICKWTR
jgi:hypothetical protein